MELRPIFEQHGSSAKKNNLRAETTQRRFSDAMRTQKVMKEVERVCESEEFYSTTTNKVQPKKSRTIRFLQTRNRKTASRFHQRAASVFITITIFGYATTSKLFILSKVPEEFVSAVCPSIVSKNQP
eukprot:scaffold2778_cov48-Cylindrotheca_fusiformis.AAC.2